MKMRRMISAVLVVMLLLSVLPGVAFGITTNDIDTKGTTTGPYDDSELYLGKTATLEDDGSYTIRLEAFATGNPVTTQLRSGLPLDIVLVLDQSGSMFSNNYLETLRESVDEFIDVIAANGRTIGVTHRVGIVGFASDVDDGSSGNADNKDHQIAGGSDNRYTNTGVFLEDGSFKNYGTAATSYVEADDPKAGGTYYIRNSSRQYQKLTESATYSAVSNPATSRKDLYARVSNAYYPAFYANNAYYAVTGLDPDETYYVDIDGVKTMITATSTTEVEYTRTNTITNADGQVYYIDTDTSDGENWIAVTCEEGGNWWDTTYTWTGADGNTYTRSGNSSNRYFTHNGTTYYAHNKTETTTVTWTTADGTVINPDDVTVYDRLSGWVYEQNGSYHSYTGTLYEASVTWKYNNTTYDPETTQFFEQAVTGGLTNDDYRDALMPVTDGEAGAGRVTEALNIAVSKIAASGATRTSLGMELAKNILDNRSSLGDEDKRQTVVIVFTDGTPGYAGFENQEANAAMEISAQLKAEDGYNATVYTIGLYAGEPVSSPVSVFMHGLSSNFPNATQMTDVATSTYAQRTIDFSEEGLTTERKLFDNYVARVQSSSSPDGYYYYPLAGRLTSGGRLILEYYASGWKSYNNIDTTSGTTDFTHNVYVRTTTAYDTTGKHYMHTDDKEELYNIFPEIITDSTTTTLDQKWLTADTLIRDIMETGFVFANGTTVTMSTLTGTSSNRMITWDGTETVIDSVTVTDATQSVVTSEKGWLSVHNEGGYAFVEATGFDFNAYFFGTSKPESGEGVTHENGAKLIITIEGVEATDNVTWNQTVLTNNPYSGVWSPVLEDSGTRAQIGVFPQPNTFFTDSVVVLDYAKTTADLAAQLRQDGVKHLDADGMNRFTEAALNLKDTYGDITAKDGQLTYTPTTMKWDGYDAFYVFGNTDDAEVIRHSANKVHNNLWSKVTVIPANNVYYEDTFVQANGATVGIEYTGEWELGNLGSNVENPEDDVQGWEDSLADDTGYSDGSAAVGGLDEKGNGATATFTFTGTGVDIYSRTNMQTGLIMAAIYAGDKVEGVPLRTLVVDNFAHSGDYYMIPTLSIHEKIKRIDGVTQYENGKMLFEELGYGTYTVKLTVFAATGDVDFDDVEETRSTYYLDGIRVYNPLKPDNINSVVKEAYGDDELNAAFAEVRDILLDAKDFDKSSDKAGAVFIDQIVTKNEEGEFEEGAVPGSTTDIGVYEAIGPENEVYLNNSQMIAFAPAEGEKYYVGLKSPTGKPIVVMITGVNGDLETFTISHTTDLFYEIGTNEKGISVITNLSEDILSVTKIKATHPDPVMQTFAMFRSVRREEVLEAADAAYAAANAPEEPELPDIEIENPETQEPENKPGYDDLLDLVVRIIGSLWDWFH